MEAAWDPAKARANLSKHGVHFADAVTALEDARAISVRDEGQDEERWMSIVWIPSAVSWWSSTRSAMSGFD